MTVIKDPSTGRGATVNPEGELVVRSINQSELEHASALGQAYTWTSDNDDIATGATRLYLRNDGDVPLVLDRITGLPGNVTADYSILVGALTTTPTGTAITGTNMNQIFSSSQAEATAFDTETAVADGTVIDHLWVPVTTSIQHSLDGIILGKNHYIQINAITETTSGRVIIVGHFEDPS